MATRVTREEYREACDGYYGWCPSCEDFTRPGTEPDVGDYDCPDCDSYEVHGAEQALLVGLISITEED